MPLNLLQGCGGTATHLMSHICTHMYVSPASYSPSPTQPEQAEHLVKEVKMKTGIYFAH